MKRVVITGMSALTSIGDCWEVVRANLQAGHSGVVVMDEWKSIQGLNCYLAAPAIFEHGHYPRKKVRGMSRVSLMATKVTEQSLAESGISSEHRDYNNLGIAYGSSIGATEQFVPFGRVLSDNLARGVSPTGYIQMMSHTAAVNLSVFFGLKGRMIPTSAACASGGQALGYAYEAIKHGITPWMIAGSAEALCPTQVAVFDSFYSASLSHEAPGKAIKPFDSHRDGLVVGEGAASFILEELEHALARNAPIIAEIVGFATNMDGSHITRPDSGIMAEVMKQALSSASLMPEAIGYINAHAAGTTGDSAEALAVRDVFSDSVPISSVKGYLGHTLGACGALEAWLTINMMNEDCFAPTLNLESIGDDCEGIQHIMHCSKELRAKYVMTNNFAFGGVNTSVIFKRWR